ncbi:hypothetical protein SAMN04490244_102160 [Tranquillimonas rosea]|uniref:50S ribosomal protein L35 n=1 Tax=Tranquillimonas rosea TaxID=641238 RepID=A0A1H9R7W5_9RHOB|nr:hypothetical protein [Tranquillimonas rosea]SER68760.1 hypothetical protein SAMN04490244_102160 [Tranquillimonas rosea]
MDADTVLVVGVLCAALSFPSLVSAYSESRPPRLAAVLLVIGGGAIVWAVSMHPGGYSLAQLPDVFTRVAAKVVN